MKFESINRKFTETVAEWMAKGWYINTASMRGSQSEIGKIDLTDGTDVIRILLDGVCVWSVRIGDHYYWFEGVKLIVGKVTDGTIPNRSDDRNTIWNNHLEVITEEHFYELNHNSRSSEKWYGTYEESIAQQDKSRERCESRRKDEGKELDDRAKAIVLPFVRRQPRCKSMNLADITAVRKVTNSSRNTVNVRYEVEVKGKTYKLN